MNYVVHDSKCGKVFGTLEEACAYAEEIRQKTGYIVSIEETKRKISHVYNFNHCPG